MRYQVKAVCSCGRELFSEECDEFDTVQMNVTPCPYHPFTTIYRTPIREDIPISDWKLHFATDPKPEPAPEIEAMKFDTTMKDLHDDTLRAVFGDERDASAEDDSEPGPIMMKPIPGCGCGWCEVLRGKSEITFQIDNGEPVELKLEAGPWVQVPLSGEIAFDLDSETHKTIMDLIEKKFGPFGADGIPDNGSWYYRIAAPGCNHDPDFEEIVHLTEEMDNLHSELESGMKTFEEIRKAASGTGVCTEPDNLTIDNCPRCYSWHILVEVSAIKNAGPDDGKRATHYAECPWLGSPILLRLVETTKKVIAEAW